VLARQVVATGGVESESGGNAPDAVVPRGESKRARTSTSTSDTGRPPRPLITSRHASRTAVVSSPELLQHVLTFLAGGKIEAREDLGRAASVCRLWREVTLGEELWGRVASEVMPAMGRRVSEVGARRCVLERGLCHRDQRAWGGDLWHRALELQVEVWDTLDETCLLSAEASLGFVGNPPAFVLVGANRVEVVCAAFSAASRDPVQRRFASIDDYFRRENDMMEQPFLIRVYVRDLMTDRQALLWDTSFGSYEGGRLQTVVMPPDDPWRAYLPESSRCVQLRDYLPIYSPALPGQALRATLGFCVRPEAGQEGVAEADKMWRVAGGDEDNYGDHPSYFYMTFGEDVTEAHLATLIRGLLI
jgi:hypothetical protein